MESLIVGIAGIHLQSFVGHVAEDATGRLLIVLCLDIARCEEGTLVRVGHHDHGHIIILTTLIETVLVIADYITVHAGPETSKAHITVAERHGVHLTQLLQVLFLQMLLEGQTLLFCTLLRGIHTQRTGIITPRGERPAALTDAAVEESLGQRRGAEDATADGTGTLAEDGDVRGVAAEVLDVPLHPLQGVDLIQDTIVAGMTLGILLRQFGMRHEAEGTRTILDTHDDHITHGEILPQVTAIPFCLETAAVDPHHHRQFVAGRLGRRGDTQIQTVLVHDVSRTTRTCGLRGHGAERVTHSHTLPGLGWLRGLPAQVANRGCCVRNSLIDGQRTIEHTLYVASLHTGSQQRLLRVGHQYNRVTVCPQAASRLTPDSCLLTPFLYLLLQRRTVRSDTGDIPFISTATGQDDILTGIAVDEACLVPKRGHILHELYGP